MARTRANKRKAEQVATEGLTGTEFDSDPKTAAKAVESKTTAKKATPKERKKKYTPEMLDRAVALRKSGTGLIRLARQLGEEFSIDVNPYSLRAAMLRHSSVKQLSELPKKAKPVKAQPVPAKPAPRRTAPKK